MKVVYFTRQADRMVFLGLSTFEFMRSQIVQSLNQFLSLETKMSSSGGAEQALMNVKRLTTAGLSYATVSGSSPLQGLVHKLRDAVAACEAFPVRHVIQRSVRNQGPSAKTGTDEVKAQNLRLASLGQPLKLKLERHASEKELKELQQSQVLVEPLVMMQALEDYLWPRVKPGSDKTNKNPEQQSEQNEQSSSSRQDSGKSRSGMIRRPKFRCSSKGSARHDGSPDSESMSCSHDESDEGNAPFPEEDLFLDEEDDDGLDDEMSDEDFDEDEEDEIEGLSHVHSLGNSEDMDEMDDEGGPSEHRNYGQRPNKPKHSQIEFCIGDVAIKPTATVFQAIREVEMHLWIKAICVYLEHCYEIGI